MKSQSVLPVMVSVAVIIAVAVLERHSKTVAAIAATMPLTAPLSLWIVAAAEAGDRLAVTQFSEGLLLSVWPTVAFLVAAWLASRAGWRLPPIIAVGYAAWGVGLALVFGLRRLLGP